MKKKTLREELPEIVMTAGMLAHVNIMESEDFEVMPAAQLWKRQDLLDRSVIFRMRDRDEFKRARLILVLGKARKGSRAE